MKKETYRLDAIRCGLVTVLEGGLVEASPKELEHVVVPDAVVSLPVVVDRTLPCLEDNSRLLLVCDRLPLNCRPPRRDGTALKLFTFLTGALDGLRRVPEVPLVCAARISGAINAMSGREFGADGEAAAAAATVAVVTPIADEFAAPRRPFESAMPRCRSVPSGSLKCRRRLIEALSQELTSVAGLLSRPVVSRPTVSLLALRRAGASSRSISSSVRPEDSWSEVVDHRELPTTGDFAVPETDIAALQPASVARCSQPRLRLAFSLVGDALPPRCCSVLS